jgi:BlaI family penicillinase repressor
MARPSSQHPTELELQILQILWRDGPAPVRHVRDTLAEVRDLAYTSVLTVMNIMTKKGYLTRQKVDGSFVYSPQVDKERTTGGMLRDLVNRAFGGSAMAVMLNLLETREIDRDELKELRDLISAKATGDANAQATTMTNGQQASKGQGNGRSPG